MVLLRLSREADFLFQAAGFDGDLRVTGFRGLEALSELFSFRISLAALDSDLDFDALVGKSALLTFFHENGERFVNGRILSLDQVREGPEFSYYEARLVPLFHFLHFRRDTRVFQNKTVREIVEKVFGDAGIPGDQYRFSLQKTYEPREYSVQYQESDYNFVTRLLEEEGIFFFFEHSRDNHVMVLGDGPVTHVAMPGEATVPFRELTGLVQAEDYIHQWRFGRQIRSGAVAQRDFNYKQPRLDLETAESASSETQLEVYRYPGGYETQARGKALAKVRLESLQALKYHGSGQTVCRRMIPGFKFKLSQHQRSDFNREYLLVRVAHEAAQPQAAAQETILPSDDRPIYRASFACVPSSQVFRPPFKARKPLIHGTQTAIVVGPGGEEIHTDEHGRVKIQFHWDREGRLDEKSSCWVRVAQPWAGGQYGFLHLPRIGQEVVVGFLEGDPDRPLIMGSVYNGDHRPPGSLPGEKTKSTIKSNTSKGGGGFNQVRFEDLRGREQVFVHAEKDQDVRVKNDRREWVGRNRSLTVKGDKKELVEKNSSTTVKGNRLLHVEGDCSGNVKGQAMVNVDGDLSLRVKGDHNVRVLGQRSTTATGDVVDSFAAAHKETAGGEIVLKAGTKVVVEAGLELTIKAAGGFIKIDPVGVTIVGNLLLINSGGAPGMAVPGRAKAPRAPEAPDQPDEADDGTPGRDMSKPQSPRSPQKEQYESLSFPEPRWPLAWQSQALKDAAASGKPFCEKCEQARTAGARGA
ncbi:MAG: type VI secretion system tip protein TssI/VgrG [Pseudomonadota bacterium]